MNAYRVYELCVALRQQIYAAQISGKITEQLERELSTIVDLIEQVAMQ